jgi:NADH-quinone oxidoreductase subunit C
MNINVIIIINIFINVLKQIRLKENCIELKTTTRHIVTIVKLFKNISFLKFLQLIDIVGVEIVGKTIKYNIIYLMLSILYQTRINIYMQISNLISIHSLSAIFLNSEWLESEVWDLFGIYFVSNSNLRRILTDYGFMYHPLKKNFPITGHYELNFSFSNKLVKVKNVILVQELRNLLSKNIWNFTFFNKEIVNKHNIKTLRSSNICFIDLYTIQYQIENKFKEVGNFFINLNKFMKKRCSYLMFYNSISRNLAIFKYWNLYKIIKI